MRKKQSFNFENFFKFSFAEKFFLEIDIYNTKNIRQLSRHHNLSYAHLIRLIAVSKKHGLIDIMKLDNKLSNNIIKLTSEGFVLKKRLTLLNDLYKEAKDYANNK